MSVIDLMISMMQQQSDKNIKSQILQTYISMFGPVPNDREKEVRSALGTATILPEELEIVKPSKNPTRKIEISLSDDTIDKLSDAFAKKMTDMQLNMIETKETIKEGFAELKETIFHALRKV